MALLVLAPRREDTARLRVDLESEAAGARALIVDDDAEILGLLGELVEREGFSVTRAATMAEAREAITATTPDVLLVDIHLPDGSGLDLLEDLGPAPPEVVLITGQSSVETAVDALRRGATDYLTKPVDVARLRMMLGNLA